MTAHEETEEIRTLRRLGYYANGASVQGEVASAARFALAEIERLRETEKGLAECHEQAMAKLTEARRERDEYRRATDTLNEELALKRQSLSESRQREEQLRAEVERLRDCKVDGGCGECVACAWATTQGEGELWQALDKATTERDAYKAALEEARDRVRVGGCRCLLDIKCLLCRIDALLHPQGEQP